MRIVFSLSLVILALLSASCAAAEDMVLHTNTDRTNVNLFLPGGLKVVRGVLVNPADANVGPGSVWGESCRHWDMAHMGLMLENVDKRNNRPNTLKKVIAAAMKEFAAKTAHPELIDAPLAFGGMSKGGGWLAELGQFYAERTIAFNNVCGWAGKPDQDLSMPAVIVIGGIPDGFKMLDAIPTQYEPARRSGAPWCLALQWGNAHNYGNANALAFPFLDAVIAAPAAPLQCGPAGETQTDAGRGWLARRPWDLGNQLRGRHRLCRLQGRQGIGRMAAQPVRRSRLAVVRLQGPARTDRRRDRRRPVQDAPLQADG